MGRYLRAMTGPSSRQAPAGWGAGYLAAPRPYPDLGAATVGRYLRATPRPPCTNWASRTGGGLFCPRPGPALDLRPRLFEGLVRLRPGQQLPRNPGPRWTLPTAATRPATRD